MEDREPQSFCPMRLDAVFVRRCLRSWSAEQMQRLHQVAVKRRCYHFAGLLRGECGRRGIPLPAPASSRPDFAELCRRGAGIGRAP